MKCTTLLLIIVLNFGSGQLWGQPPPMIVDIIDRLLFSPKIYRLVFVPYIYDEKYQHKQPTGKVAFIMPDTTLRKVYPNVLTDLGYAWGTERMLDMRTISRRPEGTIIVTNGFNYSPRIRLLIQFMQFDVTDKKALIEFRITSQFVHKDLKDHYFRVRSKMSKVNGIWRVSHVRCKKAPWSDYMFPGDEKYDPNLVPYRDNE